MVLLVGLTPGTLPVAVDWSAPALYVHGMHAHDLEVFRRCLAELEDRLLSAMRPAGATAGPAGDADRG